MRKPIFYKKLPNLQLDILLENSTFYQKLNDKNKKLFEHRIVKFIERHSFIEKEGMIVTEKVKLLIASSAIMLSFGFDNYLYDLFDTIIVYPENYFSTLTNERHLGETNPRLGVIVFSWDDFKAGVAIENDNLHLGLHEFTHALYFSFKHHQTNESDSFLYRFNKILSYIENTVIQKDLIQRAYIREYAFTNQYEFLAVLVEHFFETPGEFMQTHPKIFTMLKKLLRLDKIPI